MLIKTRTARSVSKGSLLLELLIAIALLAIILGIGSEAVFVSLQSNKVSGERDVAVGLASEALEATRSVAEEKWQNIYDLAGKGSTQYHMVQTNNKWATSTGSEVIPLNNASYTRYVIIDNVSRDASTRMIDTGTNYDPSTQKATVTVSWPNADPVVMSEYFLRWKNKACQQTSWVGSKTFPSDPAPASFCSTPITTYYNDDGHINNTGGTLQIQ